MIRKMDMVSIHGIIAGNIKVISIMITVMAMDNFLIHKENFNIKDFGIMESKQIEIWWWEERAKICCSIIRVKIQRVKNNTTIKRTTPIYIIKTQAISSPGIVLMITTIEAVKTKRFLLIKEIYSNTRLLLILASLI